ncbi:MAG: class I SAM-dependent methyltransferase [Actinobacteria bacterium]|nr:class I SAM-dependent methyltransferase [Actinomycetota bacterium]
MIRVEYCPICDSNELKVLKRYEFSSECNDQANKQISNITYVQERLNLFFDYIWKDSDTANIDMTLCKSCGFIFINPRPTDKDISIKYSVINELESARRREKSKPPTRQEKRAERTYSLLSGLGNKPPSNKRVLDFGGAEGYNLIPFSRDNECLLLDYVEYDYSDGIKRLGNDLEDIEKDEKFDIILLCHTLEHVTQPLKMIEDLASHLENKGMLYIEVPLGALIEWNLLKEPLTHLNFFSEESVSKCFELAGLSVAHISTDFQWVRYKKIWCINAVGCLNSDKVDFSSASKTTRFQMHNPYYLSILAASRGVLAARKLLVNKP